MVAASAVAGVVASAVAVAVASVEVVAVASVEAGVVASVEAGVVAVAAEEELLLLSFQLTKDQCNNIKARKSPSEEMNFRCLRSDLLWV